MFQKASELAQQAAQPSSLAAAAPNYALTGATAAGNVAGNVAKALPEVAQGLTQSDIQSVLQKGWQKATDALKNTGQFIKDNKELVGIGGQALAAMYGPQAEQFDYQKSLMEQARRNLNSPIRLTTQGG